MLSGNWAVEWAAEQADDRPKSMRNDLWQRKFSSALKVSLAR